MPFPIRCPGCEATLTVAENLVGRTIKCNKCGEMIAGKAPAAARSAAPARPATPAPAAAAPPPAGPPVSASGRPVNSTDELARLMNGMMDDSTLRKVKAATVFIVVEEKNGGGTGSGWFGLEPGLVFTNAHVIGM